MVGFVNRGAESADEAMVKKMHFLCALPLRFCLVAQGDIPDDHVQDYAVGLSFSTR